MEIVEGLYVRPALPTSIAPDLEHEIVERLKAELQPETIYVDFNATLAGERIERLHVVGYDREPQHDPGHSASVEVQESFRAMMLKARVAAIIGKVLSSKGLTGRAFDVPEVSQ